MRFAKGTAPERVQRIVQCCTANVALVLLAVLAMWPLKAAGQSPTEYQVKAAFLYNFAKFVEWPASSFTSPSSAMELCVLGQDPFGSELNEITSGKLVSGHPLEVRDVKTIEEARACHILFLAATDRAKLRSALDALRGSSVLTVSDTSNFVKQGGMINFVLQEDRVQFEVGLKAAEHAGLKISSKLLAVAKVVDG